MLSTLHSYSNLGVKNDLELFQLPPTQFSHEGSHYQEFFPISANFQNNEAIEFRIPNVGDNYLDPSSIFVHVRGRVIRDDGTLLKNPAAKTEAGLAVEDVDKVFPVDNLANSLFESCEIFLNDVRISHNELYTYRSFVDLLTETNAAMKTTLWPLCYSPDQESQVLDFKSPKGITARYERIQGSKYVDLASPIFSDLSQQTKLLPSGISMRVHLRQNPNKFRLNTSAAEARHYKFEILNVGLRARFVEIAPSVRYSIEKNLNSGQNALYLLRGVETKYRSITAGKNDFIFEDLCKSRTPAKLTFLFIKTAAFHGSFKLNPLQFDHLNMKRSILTVGGKRIEQKYDFGNDLIADAYLNYIRQLNNPFVELSQGQYKNNHFMLQYLLTPDSTTENLSPCKNENIRLMVELAEALPENYTCVILSETPHVLEVDAARNIFPFGIVKE